MAIDNRTAKSQAHWVDLALFLLAAPFLLLAVPFIGMAATLLTALEKMSGGKPDPAGIWKSSAAIGIPVAAILFVAAVINGTGSAPPKLPATPVNRYSSTGDVWVNPYVRSDGTYVPGHYRSKPDGNIGNNWSTFGNINPHTGQVGDKHRPLSSSPHGIPASSLPSVRLLTEGSEQSLPSTVTPSRNEGTPTSSELSYDERERILYAARLKSRGVAVDWKQNSLSSLMDIESRIRWSDDLRKLGVDIRWNEHTLTELMDMESRVRWSHDLQELGVLVDWRKHSLSSLMDMESRVRLARDIAKLGVNVDWNLHSLSTLMDIESRIRWARGLRRFGINVDWREHSLSSLMEMDRRAQSKERP